MKKNLSRMGLPVGFLVLILLLLVPTPPDQNLIPQVIATLEPVVAAALAWTVYGEGLAWTGVVGAVAVLAVSVVAGARRGSPRDDGLWS